MAVAPALLSAVILPLSWRPCVSPRQAACGARWPEQHRAMTTSLMTSAANPHLARLTLASAGPPEIAFAIGLKSASGPTRPWVPAGTPAALSESLLLPSLLQLPVGTACAVRTGIGEAGTALLHEKSPALPGFAASVAPQRLGWVRRGPLLWRGALPSRRGWPPWPLPLTPPPWARPEACCGRPP